EEGHLDGTAPYRHAVTGPLNVLRERLQCFNITLVCTFEQDTAQRLTDAEAYLRACVDDKDMNSGPGLRLVEAERHSASHRLRTWPTGTSAREGQRLGVRAERFSCVMRNALVKPRSGALADCMPTRLGLVAGPERARGGVGRHIGEGIQTQRAQDVGRAV